MTASLSWGWPTLFLLGAYHGINPAMGWLFAVARGMQQKSTQAVVWSLAPIALGHMLAIGAVLLLAGLIQIVLPLKLLKFTVACVLFGLGLYRIVRNRHFGWGGMQVGFRDLTIWSFLMASAHGAGLMVLPVVLTQLSFGASAGHHMHSTTGIAATLVHTLGYLAVTATVALVVYLKLGLALLRTAWFNLDLVWAAALIVTGCFTLIL
jgi:hypothetical protein